MRTICGTILAAVLVAGTAFSAAVETTPVPRQSEDTWGWWKRCGDIHNHLVKNKGVIFHIFFLFI